MDNILFFDTETTGVISKRVRNCIEDVALMPHIVQLSWSFNDHEGDFIIRPDGWTIPQEAANVHKITTERALKEGVPYVDAFKKFWVDLESADIICAHNAQFDIRMLIADYCRLTNKSRAQKFSEYIYAKKCIDTMMETIDFVGACFPDGTVGKFPRLEELYFKLFQDTFNAHNSMDDVRALRKCFYELKKIGLI